MCVWSNILQADFPLIIFRQKTTNLKFQYSQTQL